MPLSTETTRLVESQWGLATRQQLLAGGVTVSELRWAVGHRWRVVLPRVVLLSQAVPTDAQRLMAALLFAGDDSWLAGPTAGAAHKLPGCTLTPPIHVLVPRRGTTGSVAWVSVRRSYPPERIVTMGPLRVSSWARSVVDAAAVEPDHERGRTLVIEAVQQRFVRLDDVAHWVEVRGSAGRRRLRRAVSDAALGAWSLPEAQLLDLVTARPSCPCPGPTPRSSTPLEPGSPPRTWGSTTWPWP